MTYSLRLRLTPLLLLSLAVSACSEEPTRVIVPLFDVTGSNLPDAERFRAEARTLVSSLRPGTDRQAGDYIAGDAISALSWGGARLRINAAFPRLDRSHSNRGAHNRHAEMVRDSIMAQIDSLLQDPSGGQSDLLGAFEVPARVFAAHPDAEKRLVVFSDMIHSKDGLDFAAPGFTVERARELVGELQERGLIPDLSGVTVHISGFGASGDLSIDQLVALETFWSGFFRASGAIYEEKHVGPTLLNWPPR